MWNCQRRRTRGFSARTGSYDLIILDYNLPKLNGAAMLSEIRREKQHIPVLMLTIKTELQDKTEIFSRGADDYLTKPFLFETALARSGAFKTAG